MIATLLIPWLVAGLGAQAVQAPPAPPHEAFTLQSRALDEPRLVNVYLPPAYRASPSVRLPVLYMPDGGVDEDFAHMIQTVDSLIALGELRPVLVVGIPNTQRRRDLTGPTRVASDSTIAPRVGGSAAFRRFIRDELIPAIEGRYRVTDERAIIGESLAGLFIVETFLVEAALFDHYIAFDPSLWWNDGALLDSTTTLLAAQREVPRSLQLGSSGEPTLAAATARLASILASPAGDRLHSRHEARPDLTHATIFRALKPRALLGALGVASARAGAQRDSLPTELAGFARPRPAERLAHLERLLRARGLTYRTEEFAGGRAGAATTGRNVVVEVGPQGPKAILLAAHYDAVTLANGSLAGGIVDNAASVLALLNAAERLRATPLRTPVRLVLFDQEELGLIGSKRYVAAHGTDSIAAVVNFDVNGAGRTVIYGPSASVPSIAVDAVRAACAVLSTDCVPFDAFPPSDDLSFAASKLPVISIAHVGTNEARQLWLMLHAGERAALERGFMPPVLRTIHSAADVPAAADPKTVERTTALAMEIVAQLDHELRRAAEPVVHRTAPDSATILRVTQQLLDAITYGDSSVWAKYTSARWFITDEEGRRHSRTEFLAGLRPLPTGQSGKLAIHDPHMVMGTDAFVITYDIDEEHDYYGQHLRTRFHATDTWMREGEDWRLVGSQVTALPTPMKGRAVPRAVLREYSGTYALTAGITLELAADDSGLRMVRSGRADERLHALDDRIFVRNGARGFWTFERDRKGAVTRLVHWRDNNAVHWVRAGALSR
jgi:predicted alpha/beta superfamily hydrolase